MAPQETIILTDFLLAPAALHHFLTPEQFADILPQSARGGPTVKELYRELQRLRREELDAVRDNIVDEVKASRRLKREYKERRQRDDRAAVAGLDTVALEIEEEVVFSLLVPRCGTADRDIAFRPFAAQEAPPSAFDRRRHCRG